MKSFMVNNSTYHVSRDGKVFNMKGLEMKLTITKHGYVQFCSRSVAKLVAKLYNLKNPKGFLNVGYKDGNPSNCHLSNLKWQSTKFCTEGQLDNIRVGMAKHTRGKNHFRYRPFKIGRKHYETLGEASKDLGLHFTTIAARLKRPEVSDHVYIKKTSGIS
jgi:hypothetical protein